MLGSWTGRRIWPRVLVVISLSMLANGAKAQTWKLDEGLDEFTDLPVVTASVTSDRGDRLVVRCTDEKVLHSIYAPQRPIDADELAVRYRVDKTDVVESALSWENHKGLALTALTTRKSLFKNELSEAERAEFVALLEALMTGSVFVIEADGERATFSLSGSGKAIGSALVACDVSTESSE